MRTTLALLPLLGSALADTVTLNWNIGWKWVSPDGTGRPAVVVNNQWPPPTISVNEGDRLVVHVTNNLGNETTSIHFHGMYLKGANQMDGASGATQCPIPPGSTLTYDFQISQVGTYWWHSHNKGQIVDGLRGPMVVKPKNAPYKDQVDGGELLVTLGDWYHDQAPYLIRYYQSKENAAHGGPEPIPDSGLINSGQDVKFPVNPGKTYLLRVTNIGNLLPTYFEIEGHELTIVEADGIYVEPYKVDRLFLTAAQRYAVLLTTKDSTSQNYLMKCQLDIALMNVLPNDYNPNFYGYLMYDASKPLPEKQALPAGLPPFDDMVLVTSTANHYDQVDVYDKVDRQIVMDVEFTIIDGMTRAIVNKATYITQKVPTLYSALTTGKDAMNPLVYGVNSNPFVVKNSEIVEIVVNNHDSSPHPFHLHGHTVQLIARGQGPYIPGTTVLPQLLHPRPLRRDVVAVPPNGYLVVRFKADNPGVHLFHCHMEWHVEAGLTATIIESPDLLQQSTVIPYDHLEACRRLGIPTRGNAAGNTVNVLDLTGANTHPDPNPSGALIDDSMVGPPAKGQTRWPVRGMHGHSV